LLNASELNTSPSSHRWQVIGDKHEEVMCKMGAIMASGILDGGGRNVTVGLRLRSGQFRMTAAVGLNVFLQV
jgi:26S proteasome regulatory subunit N2